jgi:hypothetical protein
MISFRVLSAQVLVLLTWLAGPARAQECPLRLKASDASAGDLYGCAAALAGRRLVVGSIADDDAGSAYLYERTGNGWQERGKLTASDAAAGDQLGYAVALHDGLAVVGAPFKRTRGSASGAAYVFRCDARGCTERDRLAELLPAAARLSPFDQFGLSVAIHGSTVAVGVPGADAVDLFALSDGTWQWLQRIVPGENAASFGFSVALRGNVLVVGAPSAGAVFVFTETGGTWEGAGELRGGSASDLFGYSVALGDRPGGWTAVVGAPGAADGGAAYVFTSLDEGRILATSTPHSSDAQLGVSVAIDPEGQTVLVGARHDGERGDDAGAAFVFARQADGTFVETAKLTDARQRPGDELGLGAAIAGGVAVVGAFKDDEGGVDSGAVYSFVLDGQGGPACPTEPDLTVNIASPDTLPCPAEPFEPTIEVANGEDGASALGAQVRVDLPEEALVGVSWTCAESGGAACGAAGPQRGDIDEQVDLPAGGRLVYEVSATVRALAEDFTVRAEVLPPPGLSGEGSEATANVRVDCADLSVELAENPGSVVAGDSAGLLWRVTNLGPHTAVDARLDVDARVFDLGDLARGENRKVRTALAVSADACCTGLERLDVHAEVSGRSKDPNAANDTRDVPLPVTCRTDLAVERLEVTPEDACSGGLLSYVVEVTNEGVSDVCDAELRAAVESADLSGALCECTGAGAVTACTSSGDLGGSFDLPAGGRIECRYGGVLEAASAPFAVTATVTPSGDSAMASFTADLADLSLVKSVTPEAVAAGESVSYRLVVENEGPCAATGVVLEDPFLADLGGGPLSACAPACAGGFPCVLGGLPPGGRTRLDFSCVVDPALLVGPPFARLQVVNGATLSAAGPDPDTTNDTSAATFQAEHRADLELTVTDGLTTVYAAKPLVFTVTLRNRGPSALIDGVLTIDEPAPDGSPESEPIAVLLPGETFVKRIPGGVMPGELGELVLTATIDDPQGGTLTAFDRTLVLPAPDLDGAAVAAVMTVTGKFNLGGEVVYRVQILNGGTEDQGDNPGEELTLTLPSELRSALGSTASGGELTIADDTFRWNGAVARKSFVELDLRARIVDAGPGEEICAQATVFYDGDGDGSNEEADPTSLLEPGPEMGTRTCFVVGIGSPDIPAAGTVGWAVLAVLLAALGLARLRGGFTPAGRRPNRAERPARG